MEYLQGYTNGQLFIEESSYFPGFDFSGSKGGQLYLDFSLASWNAGCCIARTYYDGNFTISTTSSKLQLSSNAFYSGNTNSTTHGQISGFSLNTRTELIIASPEVWINDTLRNNTDDDNMFALMGQGITHANQTSDIGDSANMKLYRCCFFDAYGDRSFDFIPCTKDSSGANGVYDLIGEKFYEYRRCNILTRTYNEDDDTNTYSFQYAVKTPITVTFSYDSYSFTTTVSKGSKSAGTEPAGWYPSLDVKYDDFYFYKYFSY